MENYEVIGQIGKGSFGLVQKIKRKSDGKILVWKEMNYGKMSEREKQQLVAEVNIIRELKHPNIVRYYDRIIDKKETKIFIIMEYCECGDLGTLLKKCKKDKDFIAEDVIWKIFTQILLALNECHNRQQGKILHRDLKPANLFLDSQNNIKLGDFGLSRVMSENSVFATTHVGTPYYMSPEQIQEAKYNEKSDIWSAGCLLYEMAALKPPFEAHNHLSLAIKIKNGKFSRLPLRYSQELQNLVEMMLQIEPNRRPSVQQLMENPHLNLRLKERKLKDKHIAIKQKEDEMKKTEDQISDKKLKLQEMQEVIQNRQKFLNELEDQVRELERTERQSKLSERSQQNTPLSEQNFMNLDKDLLIQNKENENRSYFSQTAINSLTTKESMEFDEKDKVNTFSSQLSKTTSVTEEFKKEKLLLKKIGSNTPTTIAYSQEDKCTIENNQKNKINYFSNAQKEVDYLSPSPLHRQPQEFKQASNTQIDRQFRSIDQFTSKYITNTSDCISSTKKNENITSAFSTTTLNQENPSEISDQKQTLIQKQKQPMVPAKEETGFDRYKARLLQQNSSVVPQDNISHKYSLNRSKERNNSQEGKYISANPYQKAKNFGGAKLGSTKEEVSNLNEPRNKYLSIQQGSSNILQNKTESKQRTQGSIDSASFRNLENKNQIINKGGFRGFDVKQSQTLQLHQQSSTPIHSTLNHFEENPRSQREQQKNRSDSVKEGQNRQNNNYSNLIAPKNNTRNLPQSPQEKNKDFKSNSQKMINPSSNYLNRPPLIQQTHSQEENKIVSSYSDVNDKVKNRSNSNNLISYQNYLKDNQENKPNIKSSKNDSTFDREKISFEKHKMNYDKEHAQIITKQKQDSR